MSFAGLHSCRKEFSLTMLHAALSLMVLHKRRCRVSGKHCCGSRCLRSFNKLMAGRVVQPMRVKIVEIQVCFYYTFALICRPTFSLNIAPSVHHTNPPVVSSPDPGGKSARTLACVGIGQCCNAYIAILLPLMISNRCFLDLMIRCLLVRCLQHRLCALLSQIQLPS